jgi:hypothetical protein
MSPAWKSTLFRAWDIRAALITFGLVEWLGETHWKVRDDPHLLDVSVGLSVAVLAVVLAALSILVAFLNEDYAQLLAGTKRGVAGAIRPYVETAIISGITAVVSAFGLFIWPIAPPWGRVALLASALGLAVWTTVGTVELVAITARHGRLRARLPEIDATYKDAKRKKAS